MLLCSPAFIDEWHYRSRMLGSTWGYIVIIKTITNFAPEGTETGVGLALQDNRKGRLCSMPDSLSFQLPCYRTPGLRSTPSCFRH